MPKEQSRAQILEIVREALNQEKVDLFLQPIVSLPQRRRRYFECFSRIRGPNDTWIVPDQYLEVAKRAKGFDMEIGYCNRSQRADVDFPYFADVMALATWCDYLIVCLRSDASNRHIINADVLKALGPRGHVVNISRGWAVDEAAVAAIQSEVERYWSAVAGDAG